jgi:hypothetical protein
VSPEVVPRTASTGRDNADDTGAAETDMPLMAARGCRESPELKTMPMSDEGKLVPSEDLDSADSRVLTLSAKVLRGASIAILFLG